VKTIVIDDDLYAFLLTQTQEIGEGASSIIRRLVGLSPKPGKPAAEINERFDFLRQPELYQHMNNVQRFLFLLGWAYRKHPDKFDIVTTIGGNRRKYFARDSVTLEKSGSSVNPRPIGDSPYWVITNNSTAKKMEMLSDVFRMLGYADEDTSAMLRMMLKS
jgi:negative modulator of initiation of replication